MLGTTALLLVLAAMINIVVDPAGIYSERGENPEAYADSLVVSDHGLWWPENSYDERLLKKALIKHALRADCVVIGSSHAMQVSSLGRTKALSNRCKSILNLSVSGAGIEDHITLSYLTLSGSRPVRIILGMDPWIFAFGKDVRWSQYYRTDYFDARDTMIGRKRDSLETADPAWKSKLKNLFSFEYTLRSIGKGLQDLNSPPSVIAAAPALDAETGGQDAVLLPDGSLMYSAKYLNDARSTPVPIGGAVYKTELGQLNQGDAIRSYRSLISWIKNMGVEPVFLLTPYHENVWKSSNSLTAIALRTVEPTVLALAKEFDVEVIGSYDPHVAGCQASEFYDFMHVTRSCLAKLRSHKMPRESEAVLGVSAGANQTKSIK